MKKFDRVQNQKFEGYANHMFKVQWNCSLYVLYLDDYGTYFVVFYLLRVASPARCG